MPSAARTATSASSLISVYVPSWSRRKMNSPLALAAGSSSGETWRFFALCGVGHNRCPLRDLLQTY